jgi:O-Antigen ligase
MKDWGNSATSGRSVPDEVVLLCLTPLLIVLIPWDFGNDLTPWREILRYNSLAVPLIEFFFVGLAITQGFRPARALRLLLPVTKAGLIILMACALWTTLFVAVVPLNAVMGIMKFVAHCLFALAISHMLNLWCEAERNLVWPAIGWGLLGYCFIWWINTAVYRPVGDDWIRLVPGATNVRWVGFFAFTCFCAAIGTLRVQPQQSRNHWRLPLALVFATVAFAVAFWSGTRAAIVANTVAAAVCVVVLPIRRQIFFTTSISLLCGVGIAFALPTVHPAYGFHRIVVASNPVAGLDAISSDRIKIWIEIFGKFIQRPLLGWGIDQLRFTYADQANLVRNPHQAILQVLVSTGLCGLVGYLCLAARFLQSIPRKFTESYQIGGMAYLTGAIAYGLYDGFFYFTYPVMMFIVAAACLATPPPSPAVGRSG